MQLEDDQLDLVQVSQDKHHSMKIIIIVAS